MESAAERSRRISLAHGPLFSCWHDSLQELHVLEPLSGVLRPQCTHVGHQHHLPGPVPALEHLQPGKATHVTVSRVTEILVSPCMGHGGRNTSSLRRRDWLTEASCVDKHMFQHFGGRGSWEPG